MSPGRRERSDRRTRDGDAAASSGGTIRQRVARILALPAAVVLLLLGVVATGQIQGFRSSQATARSVTLALAVQDLIHQLQTERGVTAGVLGGNPSFRNELAPARKLVDQQRIVVERLVDGGGSVESQMRAALQQLDGLNAIRAATDAASAGRAATFAYFTDRITALSGVDLGLERATDDQLRRGVNALIALQDIVEATAQERAFLNGVFSAGGFAKGEFVQFAAMRAAKETATNRFNQFATPAERASFTFVFGTGAGQETTFFEQTAIDAADGHHIVVNPQSWWSGLTTVLDDLRQLQQYVGSEIQLRAHDLQTASAQRIGGLVGLVLLCFAGSIYLAALASMSITRPLAALSAEADSVAVNRLPAAVRRVQGGSADDPPEPPAPVQVPTRATEEIRSVATALDRLQAAAYELATEQALQRRRTIESLANLGRRNQNLIRRQLGFITSLEREEIDPAALANLFELDHLATRMRRNAASLLVLVGASSPRQWHTPVPVADVIRAAVSEVEEYRRVSLRRVDDSMVAGSAVGAVAHLLSELIENGLTFSPPDSEVEIQGRRLTDGYLIAITDQGVGMSSEDLRIANSRLRGEGDFIAAPTRFLGHFVVGELARQTNVHVELLPSPVIGVTARVTLPEALLSMSLSVEASPTAEDLSGPRHAVALPEAPAQLPAGSAPAAFWQDEPASTGPLRLPLPGQPAAAATADGAQTGSVPSAPAAASTGSVPVTPLGPLPTGPLSTGPLSTGPLPTGPLPSGPLPTGPLPTGPLPTGPLPTLPAAAANGPWAVPNGTRNRVPPGASVPPLAPVPPAPIPTTASVPEPSLFEPPAPERRTGGPMVPPAATILLRPQASNRPFGGATGPVPSVTAGRMPEPLSTGPSDRERDRTRNGLPKRQPRDQRPADKAAPSTRRVIDLSAAERAAAVVDSSPSQVSARLTALRAGLQRGQGAPGAGTTRSWQPAGSDVEDPE